MSFLSTAPKQFGNCHLNLVLSIQLFHPSSLLAFSYALGFTAKNTVTSPDFLVWKFCGKTQFLHSFGRFARNYAETVRFHKIFTPRNQVKLQYFFAVVKPLEVVLQSGFINCDMIVLLNHHETYGIRIETAGLFTITANNTVISPDFLV